MSSESIAGHISSSDPPSNSNSSVHQSPVPSTDQMANNQDPPADLNRINPPNDDARSQHGDNTVAPNVLRPLWERLTPDRNPAPSCITIPPYTGTFQFRSGMIALLPQFYGFDTEKAYLHIHEFEQVCSTFADQTYPTEIIRLKLFPFTLKEKAKAWLLTLRPNSIST